MEEELVGTEEDLEFGYEDVVIEKEGQTWKTVEKCCDCEAFGADHGV